MLHRILALAAASFLSSTTLAQPTDAPATPPVQSKPTTKSRPTIYNEKADAKQQIAAALASAKANNRRVLIQWGGNWCSWCILLNKTMKADKALAKELNYEYDVVHIDAGQPDDKNLDLATTYGADLKKNGFPFLTILDAAGKPLANHETSSLELKDDKGESVLGDKAGHDPKKLLDLLKKHEATPVLAQDLLDKALADAKAANKSVFIHFGAPWCSWCHRLENWMARPEVAALLAKDFVSVKIDQDRNTGGLNLLTKMRTNNDGGIPWFAFLDASGTTIATSTVSKANLGFPAEPGEIEQFGVLLRKAAKNLTSAEIDALTTLLKSDKPATTH